jgi:hypothetical protein
MPAKQNCLYCGKVLSTTQGLKAHVTSTPTCRASEAQARQLAASTSTSVQMLQPSPDESISASLSRQAAPPSMPSSPLPLVPPIDSPQPPKRPQPTVEEVPDEGDPIHHPHSFSGPTFAEFFPHQVATTYNELNNPFERRHQQQEKDDLSPFAPFVDREEWELASLLMKSEISQTAVNNLLNLDIVSVSLPFGYFNCQQHFGLKDSGPNKC